MPKYMVSYTIKHINTHQNSHVCFSKEPTKKTGYAKSHLDYQYTPGELITSRKLSRYTTKTSNTKYFLISTKAQQVNMPLMKKQYIK